MNGEGNEICVVDGGDVTHNPKIINICEPPLQGRYVHVKVIGENRSFALCEIEVYGSKGKKIILSFYFFYLPFL